MLNFLYQLGNYQRVMHTNSNKVPTQNQLAMGGVTHKLIYMLKPFNFINVGQHPLSYSLYFYQCEIIPTFILQHRGTMCAQKVEGSLKKKEKNNRRREGKLIDG